VPNTGFFQYGERLRAHMGNSDAVGRMPAPHGVGTSGSSDCGDTVRIEVALREGCVETIRFQAYGCPAAIGAAAEVARGAEGVALLDILSRGATDVAEVLELPPEKRGCVAVAIDALHSALEDAVRNNRNVLSGVASAGQQGVLVAMSGGVDSSVAALLLQRQGYQVVGVTFRLWSDPACTAIRGCCSPETIQRAREVAHGLGVPHLTVDATEEFLEKVVGVFINEYSGARTPNPCVRCNSDFRFAALAELADTMGLYWIATGHYAKMDSSAGTLKRGVDSNKDQSYVLASTHSELLSRCIFPLGGQTKEETRIQARAAGLVTQDSPESQEICFIPDDDYRRFLQSRLGKSPGRIVNTSGRVLGRHTGIYNFTLGQRRGLGVSVSEPLYVVELRPDECDVVVGSAEEALIWTVRVDGLVQHVDELPEHGYTQLRSTGGAVGVRIEKDGEEMLLHLEEAVRGVAPGQAAVVYVDDVVVAAGAISSVSG